MEWVRSPVPRAPGLRKNLTLPPESGKEEQTKELETNCEQMLGRIIRNVWEAHQDRWMRQNKHWAHSSSSCCPGGKSVERKEEPSWTEKLVLCGFCSPGPPLAAAPALLWLRSNITLGCRISASRFPCFHLSCELGKWRQVSLSFHLICGCRWREESKVSEQDSSQKGQKIPCKVIKSVI